MKTLFELKSVKKFYSVLNYLCHGCEKRIKTVKDKYGRCEQEVFIRRYCKNFEGRYFKWAANEPTGEIKRVGDGYSDYEKVYAKYNKYIFISRIIHALNYGDGITVYYFDAAKPIELQEIILTHNQVLRLEAEKITKGDYNKVLELFTYVCT